MRVCIKIKNFSLIVVFVCISLIYLYFKSNQLSLQSKTIENSFNKFENSFSNSNNNNNENYQSLKSEYPSKWRVLSDGTVVHLGNFSDKSLTEISFLINNENICKNFSFDSMKTLILIESEANNFERRETVRQTWAQKSFQKVFNFKIVFILGLHPKREKTVDIQDKIFAESLAFNDLIQINVLEDFKNLTLKSMASLKWFLTYCPKVDYYFKTDDDILIHPNNLMTELKAFKSNENSILCHKNKNRKIIRSFERISQLMGSYRQSVNRFVTLNELKKKIMKYKIHYSQLPGLYFPPYCSGFGYAFSAQVAKRLYTTALTIPYFLIEDVFITGFCRQKANIDIKESELLTLRPLLRTSEDICAFSYGRISSNEMSNEDIRTLWLNINTHSNLCPNNTSVL